MSKYNLYGLNFLITNHKCAMREHSMDHNQKYFISANENEAQRKRPSKASQINTENNENKYFAKTNVIYWRDVI